jgi:hypothetical protein
VVVFVRVIPEAKQRQLKQALDAYEALWPDKSQAAGRREAAVQPAEHEESRKQP